MADTKLETIQSETLNQVTGGFLDNLFSGSGNGLFSSIMPGGGQMGQTAGGENLFRPGGGPQTPRGNGFLGKIWGNAGQG